MRVVFMHIPKTGGTTLHELLLPHFDPERVCPERYNRLDRFSADEIASYQFFSGHFTFDRVEAHIPGPKRVITMLREPRARLVSLYYFSRSHTWAAIEARPEFSEKPTCWEVYGVCYRAAKEMDLLTFLESERAYLQDMMVRWIGGNEGPPLVRFRRAIRRLRRLDAFGLLESMRPSVELIFGTLGLPVPAEIPRRQAFEDMKDLPHGESVPREPMTEAIWQKLSELTVLDRAFYAYARRLFWVRYALFRVRRVLAGRRSHRMAV